MWVVVAVYQVFSASGRCPFSFVLEEMLSVFLFSWGPFFGLVVFFLVGFALLVINSYLSKKKKKIPMFGVFIDAPASNPYSWEKRLVLKSSP